MQYFPCAQARYRCRSRWSFCRLLGFLPTLLIVSAASAECLWDDKPSLDSRFKEFVNKATPKHCRPIAFGYATVFSSEAEELKFEVNLRLSKSCFGALASNLETAERAGRLPSCRANTAHTVKIFPDADAGQALIFVFKASPAEIREAARYGN